jgi:hypothetical protein
LRPSLENGASLPTTRAMVRARAAPSAAILLPHHRPFCTRAASSAAICALACQWPFARRFWKSRFSLMSRDRAWFRFSDVPLSRGSGLDEGKSTQVIGAVTIHHSGWGAREDIPGGGSSLGGSGPRRFSAEGRRQFEGFGASSWSAGFPSRVGACRRGSVLAARSGSGEGHFEHGKVTGQQFWDFLREFQIIVTRQFPQIPSKGPASREPRESPHRASRPLPSSSPL